MVFPTRVLGYAARKPMRKYLRSGFMDSLRIHVKGGAGGMGLPRYGGIGGRGGHVIVESKEGCKLDSILKKRKNSRFHAECGGNSSQNGIIGGRGNDLIVEVPPGISVYHESGTLMGDLNKPGTKLRVARGGIGGCPETGFSGQKGEAHCVVLDLKLIADVGLVGFPNAGKSTLLGSVSQAKPKVASYPFTTIRPHLGMMHFKDLRTISVADLPGLIEGAHANVGMGHKFLKHLDRTKLLVYMVDVQGFQLSPMHKRRTCLETVVLLNKEVELYKPDLLRMPSVLIVNKMDTENATEIYRDIEPCLRDLQSTVNDCDEEIRPERVLQFDEIITTSLIRKLPEEVEKVKSLMRRTLDRHYERKLTDDTDFAEERIVEKLKRESRQRAPTLL